MSGIDDGVWDRIVTDLPVLPKGVDAVWLNSFSTRGNVLPSVHPGFENINGPIGGMGAVLYTPQGARKILELFKRSEVLVSRQIDGTFGAMAARYPDELVMLRSRDNVVTFPASAFFDSSIQSSEIKPFLPSTNWFYLIFLVALLGLITMTLVLARRLRKENKKSRRE